MLLVLLSMLFNLGRLPLRGEEALRLTVAFEMFHSSDYFQPTFLGESYYNKPPLFNWLIILFSYLIPWSELTGRIVSLTFSFLTSLLTAFFAHILFKNMNLAMLSGMTFLTFGNIIFFYGYLAEIDATFGFFVSGGIFSLYLWFEKRAFIYSVLAGLFFGLSALLKGFPSYAFLSLSLVAFLIYYRNFEPFFNRKMLPTYTLPLFIPLLWLFQTPDPLTYIQNLWRESFSRVTGEFSRLEHMLTYPLLNFKDTLPWSFLFLTSLYLSKKNLTFPTQLRLLSLIFFLNYLPYWLSDSAGRYIIPLYPLLAIIFSFYIQQSLQRVEFRRLLTFLLVGMVAIRFFYGLVFFPYQEGRESSRKRIASEIHTLVHPSESIACECPEEKSVCIYLGIWKGQPLKRLSQTPEAKYAIVCGKSTGEPIKEYRLKSKSLSLVRLNY